MVCEVGGGPGQVVEVRLAHVPLLYDQVDGHLAFEAADVAVAEVITELMDLREGYTLCPLDSLNYYISYQNK